MKFDTISLNNVIKNMQSESIGFLIQYWLVKDGESLDNAKQIKNMTQAWLLVREKAAEAIGAAGIYMTEGYPLEEGNQIPGIKMIYIVKDDTDILETGPVENLIMHVICDSINDYTRLPVEDPYSNWRKNNENN